MTLEAIRARHIDSGYPHDPQRCDRDGLDWPCDTAEVLAILDEREQSDYLYPLYEKAAAALDASREREKALAEALRGLTCQDDGTPNALRDDFPDGGDIVLRWPGNRQSWADALVALAAHEEAQK